MATSDRTLIITDDNSGVYTFHAYGDINIREYVEASTMTNRGGRSLTFNHGKRPIELSGQIECKGGLAVPVPVGDPKQILTQATSVEVQLKTLRSLIGQVVTIDCSDAPPGGVTGLLQEGTTKPDLENDSGAFFSFNLTEDQDAGAFGIAANFFGEIAILQRSNNVNSVPKDDPRCFTTTKRVFSTKKLRDIIAAETRANNARNKAAIKDIYGNTKQVIAKKARENHTLQVGLKGLQAVGGFAKNNWKDTAKKTKVAGREIRDRTGADEIAERIRAGLEDTKKAGSDIAMGAKVAGALLVYSGRKTKTEFVKFGHGAFDLLTKEKEVCR